MSLQNDLTQGNVNKHIIRFSLPLLLGNLLQALYNAVDMYFAGKYLGTAGLCAVSVSGPIMNVLLMTIIGMSIGVSVIIGANVGRGDQEGIKKAAGTAISLYAIIALCVSSAGVIFSPALLRLVATPEEAFEMAVSYLRIIFAGFVFTLGYNLICAFQRGFGDSRSPLLFVGIATVMNVVLDMFFMKILNMGVSGAALATIISQAAAFIMGLIYFRIRKHIITFSPRAWRWHKPSLKELVRIGLPSALQQLSLNVSHMTLNGIVNTYGLVASAAYGIGVKMDSFAILPTLALNDAVSTFASQNLGANQEKRALESVQAARRIAIIINIAVTAIIVLFASSLASIFNQDPAVIQTAANYLHITCIMYLMLAYIYPAQGFARGSGNAMFTLTNGLQAQYIVRIPVALLLSKVAGLGIYGVALAWLSAPIYSSITYGLFMKKEKWRGAVKRAQDVSQEQ